MTQETETVTPLTRPIIGIENRTPLEVFDIMCDRIDGATRISTNKDETIAKLVEHIAEQITHAETRIQDGKELGAAVWRIALEDIIRENRDLLTSTKKEG